MKTKIEIEAETITEACNILNSIRMAAHGMGETTITPTVSKSAMALRYAEAARLWEAEHGKPKELKDLNKVGGYKVRHRRKRRGVRRVINWREYGLKNHAKQILRFNSQGYDKLAIARKLYAQLSEKPHGITKKDALARLYWIASTTIRKKGGESET